MRDLDRREIYFGLAMVVLVFVLGWLSYLTRPSETVSSSWWPAAGVAIGAGARYSRRYAPVVALLTGLIAIPVASVVSGSTIVGAALGFVTMLETLVGILILRGRSDTRPALGEPRDLAPLLIAAFSAAIVLDVGAATVQAIAAGSSAQLFSLSSAALRHAAGILLVAPLFMRTSRWRAVAHPAEVVAQVVVTTCTTALVFAVNRDLPLAFLPFVPLVWAALRVSTRVVVLEVIAVSAIAAYGSAWGAGPFSFTRLGPVDGSLILQVFQLSMLIVFLSLSLTVSRGQESRRRLTESEQLFRNSFNESFEGLAIITWRDQSWVVERHNAAAGEILPTVAEGETDLEAILGVENAGILAQARRAEADLPRSIALELADGRHLQASIALLGAAHTPETFVLQLLDVTDSFRARRLVQEEFDRAGEIQRALTPISVPSMPGWSCAAVSYPARQVGGDFCDIRVEGSHATLSLGDVMGKGVGAGMLAASARTALRAVSSQTSPAQALTQSAAVLNEDLARSQAFVTLVSAVVDLPGGRVRLADAGHGLAFVVSHDGAVSRFASHDLPLGLGGRWSDVEIMLEHGDALLLVSDGVMDLWGTTVGDLQGGIEQSAARAGDDVGLLAKTLCATAGDVAERDDVTAVIIRRGTWERV